MASKNALIPVLLLVLASSALFVTTIQAVQPDKPSKINTGLISHILSDKGYHAMSLTLDTINLEALIPTQLLTNNTSTLTLFCPKDQAFFTSKYPQPPLTLLKYHSVPFKIDQDTFKTSSTSDFGHGSKVETILPGHPLVVTSLTGGSEASLSQVKVTEWDVYNDGKLIIHGVEDFFDPAFQTLRYPQYDTKKVYNVKEVPSSNWLVEATENWVLLTSLAAASIAVLIVFFIFYAKPTQQQEEDAHTPLCQ